MTEEVLELINCNGKTNGPKMFFSQVAAAKAEFAELFAAAEVTSQKALLCSLEMR